jgi:hypothetical protein
MDVFVDGHSDLVAIVEVKSTNWDAVKSPNRSRLMTSHRRQVWTYIMKYIEEDHVDVSAGIIYPRSPRTAHLKEQIEDYFNEYAIQVVWYFDTQKPALSGHRPRCHRPPVLPGEC